MTTPNSASDASEVDEDIVDLITGSCGADPFKVESDLGHGYVRLKSSEVERRQAAQDIQCIEDALIELLRNSRDASAHSIFVASSKDDDERTLTIIDDGEGIPEEMWQTIFEPRVTSKLETAHMDKWGMHGRGMALYSITMNARSAQVMASRPGCGASLRIDAGKSLSEKADQSSFPHFEEKDGIMAMRGPKNITRTCCEFALECASGINVYLGTPAQISAALYEYGLATVPAYARAFGRCEDLPLTKTLGLSNSPEDLAARCAELGLDISLRTARRIMDGSFETLPDVAQMMRERSFNTVAKSRKRAQAPSTGGFTPHLAQQDKRSIADAAQSAFADIAESYYLEPDVEPSVRVSAGALLISIPLVERI